MKDKTPQGKITQLRSTRVLFAVPAAPARTSDGRLGQALDTLWENTQVSQEEVNSVLNFVDGMIASTAGVNQEKLLTIRESITRLFRATGSSSDALIILSELGIGQPNTTEASDG